MSLHLALVHYPMLNKDGSVVCTSVTNLDVHDLSRIGRTYGAEVWVVHPYEPQRRFLRRAMRHWLEGWGSVYNPTRCEALGGTRLVGDVGEVVAGIEGVEGRRPVLVGTHARVMVQTVTHGALRGRIEKEPEQPFVIVFGTGWGLHPELMEQMDLVLEPVVGPTDWNHLSVRAAAGIIVDRLRGLGHPHGGTKLEG